MDSWCISSLKTATWKITGSAKNPRHKDRPTALPTPRAHWSSNTISHWKKPGEMAEPRYGTGKERDEPGMAFGSQKQGSSQAHLSGVQSGQERLPPRKDETTTSLIKGKLWCFGTHREYSHLRVYENTCKTHRSVFEEASKSTHYFANYKRRERIKHVSCSLYINSSS